PTLCAPSLHDALPICNEPSLVAGQPRLLPMGASDGYVELFYDSVGETYWLLSPQSTRGITPDQAADFLRLHPQKKRCGSEASGTDRKSTRLNSSHLGI